VNAQEYFIKNNEQIIKAASEYGAVMFKNFDIQSGEEFASILYKSGLKEV
jgi:alpha-ketoglutarate-dependent taurine dioxygenase